MTTANVLANHVHHYDGPPPFIWVGVVFHFLLIAAVVVLAVQLGKARRNSGQCSQHSNESKGATND